jgi:hypothetical protein
MGDYDLSNEGLLSPNIWDFLYSEIKYLLVTKVPKKDCSIVNKFFRCFLVNCYTIVLILFV